MVLMQWCDPISFTPRLQRGVNETDSPGCLNTKKLINQPMQSNSSPATDLFLSPTNVGDAAEPSYVGRSGSFQCGATLRISLRIDEEQRIAEAKFRAAGCSVLVASAALLTEQVRGMTTATRPRSGNTPLNKENSAPYPQHEASARCWRAKPSSLPFAVSATLRAKSGKAMKRDLYLFLRLGTNHRTQIQQQGLRTCGGNSGLQRRRRLPFVLPFDRRHIGRGEW